jgi:AI-2 transport protein TqsA
MNDKDNSFSFTLRILLGLAAACVVLYFMHFISDLINNLFLAFMIVVTATPLLNWLRNKGMPNWLAFVLTLTAVAVGSLLLLLFIVHAAASITDNLSNYKDQLQELQDMLDNLGFRLPLVDINLDSLLNLIELPRIFQAATGFISSILDTVGRFFLIILFVIFMLLQAFTTPEILRQDIAAGNIYLQRFLTYIKDLREYLLITAVIAVVTGGLDTILFLILGIPNAFIWGGVAAILSFVPTIGFWIAAVPPTLLAFFEYGPLIALVTLAGIVVINGLADNVIKPRFIGTGLNLASFIVIFSVVFWAIILGPIGAIIGVPMSMAVKSLLFEADDNFKWAAHLMSSGLDDGDMAEAPSETDAAED